MFHNLLSFGDIIELKVNCDTQKILKELKDFKWVQYNPRKEINRYGCQISGSSFWKPQ